MPCVRMAESGESRMEDQRDIEEMMAEMIETILAEARTGETADQTELLVALLHQEGNPAKLAYVAMDNGDGEGREEIRELCEEAQETLLVGERLSVESFQLVELLMAFRVVGPEQDSIASGGEE